METIQALAPYLLLLLCPLTMFFSMRFMMKGMHGQQSGMNIAPPRADISDVKLAKMDEEVARPKADNEQLQQAQSQPTKVGESLQ